MGTSWPEDDRPGRHGNRAGVRRRAHRPGADDAASFPESHQTSGAAGPLSVLRVGRLWTTAARVVSRAMTASPSWPALLLGLLAAGAPSAEAQNVEVESPRASLEAFLTAGREG